MWTKKDIFLFAGLCFICLSTSCMKKQVIIKKKKSRKTLFQGLKCENSFVQGSSRGGIVYDTLINYIKECDFQEDRLQAINMAVSNIVEYCIFKAETSIDDIAFGLQEIDYVGRVFCIPGVSFIANKIAKFIVFKIFDFEAAKKNKGIAKKYIRELLKSNLARESEQDKLRKKNLKEKVFLLIEDIEKQDEARDDSKCKIRLSNKSLVLNKVFLFSCSKKNACKTSSFVRIENLDEVEDDEADPDYDDFIWFKRAINPFAPQEEQELRMFVDMHLVVLFLARRNKEIFYKLLRLANVSKKWDKSFYNYINSPKKIPEFERTGESFYFDAIKKLRRKLKECKSRKCKTKKSKKIKI